MRYNDFNNKEITKKRCLNLVIAKTNGLSSCLSVATNSKGMETYVRDYANPQIEDVKLEILQYCREARSKEEILNLIRVEIKPYHVRKYITRLVEERYLQFTVSNNPRSNGQKYIITTKGTTYLKALT